MVKFVNKNAPAVRIELAGQRHVRSVRLCGRFARSRVRHPAAARMVGSATHQGVLFNHCLVILRTKVVIFPTDFC
jgi:hypothetical protein